jgi:sporulation protein YlmC with PRC-barrel domain
VKHRISLLAGAAVIAAALGLPALAQDAPSALSMTKIDQHTLATGQRASKIVGSSVTNSANESIGTVQDLVIAQDGSLPNAVLSVGSYLGGGTKTVQIPFESLQMRNNQIILPDATKDSLKRLPEFTLAAADREVSKVLGSSITNGNNETVGTLDDLLIMPNQKVPYAVLSVGSFLGIGGKYVVVPYGALEIRNNQIVVHDATKSSLQSLPEFKYSD